MSGSISFNNIPNSIRVPGSYVEFDNSRALRGLNDWPARVLIMGQRLTAGTIAQGVPIRVIDAAQARTYFGRGSNVRALPPPAPSRSPGLPLRRA